MMAVLGSNPRNADQYVYVRAWYTEFCDVNTYYARAKQLQAVVEDAPLDAVYHNSRRWVRVGEISNEQLRQRVEAVVSCLKI